MVLRPPISQLTDTPDPLTTLIQSEGNGSKERRQILGDEERKKKNLFPATYIGFGGEQEAMSEEGRLAWYDSRANKPSAAERRIYYQTNGVTSLMRPGDTLFLARRRDDQLFFIVKPEGSTIESQLL